MAVLCYSDRVEKLQQRQCDLQSLKHLHGKEVCQSLIQPELQEIPVATREQSGVLCFHSRWMPVSPGASGMQPRDPGRPGEEHWLPDTSLDEVYWPCSHSRAIPSFPSQLEWKIGLPWANTRGILNSPS